MAMKNEALHIGVKLIKATAMTRLAYNDYRGWTLPENENGDDTGFMVEYIDGGKSNHPDHEGYISWSPADVFARAYRRTDGLSFGLAIEAMKQGLRVARKGWNGKGMWVALTPGSEIAAHHARLGHAAAHRAAEGAQSINLLPHIDMRAADGSMVVGWLASQTDMLADDWQVVGEAHA